VRRDSSQRQGATLGEGVQLIAFSCRLSAFRPGSDYHPPPPPPLDLSESSTYKEFCARSLNHKKLEAKSCKQRTLRARGSLAHPRLRFDVATQQLQTSRTPITKVNSI